MGHPDEQELGIIEEPKAPTTASMLAIYHDKLATRRRLANLDPSNLQWRSDEAEILGLIAMEFRHAGLVERAIRPFEESCAILRELTDLDPRNSHLRRHFSMNLAQLAKARLDLGDQPGALADHEECRLLHRKVSRRRASYADQCTVVDNLASVADLRHEAGDDEGAFQAYEELLPKEHELVSRDPSNLSLQWNLSRTLDRVGDAKRSLEDTSGALIAYEESLTILRRLSQSDLSDVPLQEESCCSLKKIGDLRLDIGDMEGALSVYEERLPLARVLRRTHPSNAVWQSTLATSLEDVAAMRLHHGDNDVALKHYTESLEIRRRANEVDQADPARLHELCFTLEAIATLQSAKERLACYEESLGHRRLLSMLEPGHHPREETLRLLEQIGDLQCTLGDYDGALSAYEELLLIRRASSEAGDGTQQRNIWSELNRIADLKLAIGDIDGAIAGFQECVTLAKQASRPNQANGLSSSRTLSIGEMIRRLAFNASHQDQCDHDLTQSLDRLCGVKLKGGDISGAIAAYEELIQHEDEVLSRALKTRWRATHR
jgi:tetratricopeptide (TPR) repeat protein